MIAGLPWQSWLLLLASVGVGLAVELVFFRNQRRRRRNSRAGGDREREEPR